MSRTVRTRIACVVTAALVISWGGPAANAFWQTLGSNAGAAKADVIPAVAAPSAAGSAGSAAVSWVQGSTAAGRPVSGYTVARYSSAVGGTKVAAGGGCAGTITALGCTESGLPGGTWYYTVTPVLASWQGVESTRSGGVIGDSIAPAAPIVSAPQIVSSANVASVPVSGTAEAGSSVNVTVTDTPPVGTPQQTASQTLTANGSGQWTALDFNLTAFADGTISYSAIATDASGNPSAQGTVTSTKDATPPTAKVQLVNLPNSSKNKDGFADPGDTVVITYSEAMNASSICSAWTDNAATYLLSANNEVAIRVDASNNLSVSLATNSTCPTLRLGGVALGGAYAGTSPLIFKGGGQNVSSVSWNGTARTLTLKLGKIDSGTQAALAAADGSPVLTPSPGVTDLAGNQATGVQPDQASGF